MRQLVFVEPGRLEWQEAPAPALLEETDALVRPVAVATCDLDAALMAGATPVSGPFAMGHEGVAEVVETGPAVVSVRTGQRVIVPFQLSCGACERCRRGLTGSCTVAGPGAMYGFEPFGGSWGGFLADLVRVPWADAMLLPLPEGVDPVAFAPDAGTASHRGRVIFAGVMDAAPNVSAAEFLARAVMPLVRAQIPAAHLVIVGRRPGTAVRRLSRLPGVEVVGEVTDMRPWLTTSQVCACPMVSGTGIKNKLLEGMASGVPCVVTPHALRGVPAISGRDLLVGEDAEQVAAHVTFLLRDRRAARAIGAAGCAYVLSKHTWRGVAEAYVRLYQSLLAEPGNGRKR